MSSERPTPEWSLSCPTPSVESEKISLGHGSGGKLTARLIEQTIIPRFRNEWMERLDDQAMLTTGGERIAFTTDSFVVTPLFFPGGDIGALAVNGTVNDLAMGGATPRWLSLSLILEEGLEMKTLQRVLDSIRTAADRAGVSIVTGDTKVVGRGGADKLFINTAGIGVVEAGRELSSARVQPGDAIVLSGSIGDHGMAILSQRQGLDIGGDLRSDTAPLHELVRAMLDTGADIHAMRDPTRGGVAATLVEIATRRKLGLRIDEQAIAVKDVVRGACEILGLDPLFVANEGKLVAFVAEKDVDRVLSAMTAHPLGRDARCIGRVETGRPGIVSVQTTIGTVRVLDLPLAEALPRIC